MALSDGMLQLDDIDLTFAEGVNQHTYAFEGNQVMLGLKVVPDTPASLSIDTQSGYFISSTIPKKQIVDTIDLTADVPAVGGESVFVYIYFTSGGTLSKLTGTPDVTGDQFPPLFSSLPNDACLLARVLLTNGDTTIVAAQIKDLRVFSPPVEIVISTATEDESIRKYHDAAWAYFDIDSGITNGLKIRKATTSPYVSMIDKLIFADDGSLDIPLHDLATIGLKLAGAVVTASAAELNKLDGATATTAELNFVAGVTSAIQTQIDAKTGVGSANEKFYTMTFIGSDQVGQDDWEMAANGDIEGVKIVTATNWIFQFTEPLKLTSADSPRFRVTNARVILEGANGTNLVTLIQILAKRPGVETVIVTDAADADSVGTHQFNGTPWTAFSVQDTLIANSSLTLRLSIDLAATNIFILRSVEIEGYYL